jgi:hypothetical protein
MWKNLSNKKIEEKQGRHPVAKLNYMKNVYTTSYIFNKDQKLAFFLYEFRSQSGATGYSKGCVRSLMSR